MIPLDQVLRFEDVLVSNEVLIFGYPASLGLTTQLDHSRPLLRRGIVAGKNERNGTIIIDAPVYPGNSGGPVIQIEWTGGDRRGLLIRVFRLIGVVVEFVPALIERNIVNSGYAVAVPMDRVLDAIDGLEKKSTSNQ